MPTVNNRLHRYGYNLTQEQKWELGGIVRKAYEESGINKKIFRRKSIEGDQEFVVRDYCPEFNGQMDQAIFKFCAALEIKPTSLISREIRLPQIKERKRIPSQKPAYSAKPQQSNG